MRDLTQGSLKKHLVELAIPSIGGMLAFSLFNLTDTYFVGKLGTESLAAMGFTFPIMMILAAITSGVSTGAASVLSRAAGNKDLYKMRRTATDGILLSILLVVLFSTAGLLSMDWLFTKMGAGPDTLPLIKQYMTIYYSWIFVVLMPPVSDSAMRAVGDMKRPFKVMLVCALGNMVLDPIFIFGWFGLPAMGIKGAAIATILSRFAGMVLTLYFTYHHHKLIVLKLPTFEELKASWKSILSVGVPGVGVALLPQLIRMALTGLAAYTGGTIAVAAVAAGSRLEGFILLIANAIGVSIIPMVGQNYGAKEMTRISDLRKLLNKSAILISSGMLLIVFVMARPLVMVFTKDPEVINLTITYLIIMTTGSIGLNLYNFNSQIFNAMAMATKVLLINGLGTALIILPLMVLGSRFSFENMLLGLALGQILVGILSLNVVKRFINSTLA